MIGIVTLLFRGKTGKNWVHDFSTCPTRFQKAGSIEHEKVPMHSCCPSEFETSGSENLIATPGLVT